MHCVVAARCMLFALLFFGQAIEKMINEYRVQLELEHQAEMEAAEREAEASNSDDSKTTQVSCILLRALHGRMLHDAWSRGRMIACRMWACCMIAWSHVERCVQAAAPPVLKSPCLVLFFPAHFSGLCGLKSTRPCITSS